MAAPLALLPRSEQRRGAQLPLNSGFLWGS